MGISSSGKTAFLYWNGALPKVQCKYMMCSLAMTNKGRTSVRLWAQHYNDIIMSVMVSQITSLMIVYSSVYWGADQRKHQSSMSLAFVGGIHWWLVNSPHKGPVMRKMFPFDDVIIRKKPHIMSSSAFYGCLLWVLWGYLTILMV